MKFEVPYSFHRSLEERDKSVTQEFKNGGVLPAYALSCSDGIVILGLSRIPGILKVRRVLDRVAFVGVGKISHCEKLYKSVSAFAKTKAFIELSLGDMRVVNDIVGIISESVQASYRNLASNDYFTCETMVVKLGFEPSSDQIYKIDFRGDSSFSSEVGFIPNFYGPPCDLNIRHTNCLGAVTSLGDEFRQKYGPNLFFDVAILSRELANQKSFSNVYAKLKI